MQRIKICHLQENWHLDLAKDKNRRSPGVRAFLARDFARAIGFAKSSTTWHFCQVCSLICQVAQIANSKCKTVRYLFWSFLANYSNANFKCKTLGGDRVGTDKIQSTGQMPSPWSYTEYRVVHRASKLKPVVLQKAISINLMRLIITEGYNQRLKSGLTPRWKYSYSKYCKICSRSSAPHHNMSREVDDDCRYQDLLI